MTNMRLPQTASEDDHTPLVIEFSEAESPKTQATVNFETRSQSQFPALTPSRVLSLQRSIGNQAVMRMMGVTEKPASVQRMSLERYHELLKTAARKDIQATGGVGVKGDEEQAVREWVAEFIKWMEKEYEDWEAKGAFITGGRGYTWMWDYIEDKAFDAEVFNVHMQDYLDYLSQNGSQEERLVRGMSGLTSKGLSWTNPVTLGKGNIKENEQKKPFYKWLFAYGEKPTQMNCWEAVLYAAYEAGLADRDYIRRAIQRTGGAPQLVLSILQNPAGQVVDSAKLDDKKIGIDWVAGKVLAIPTTTQIPKGHVVLFGSNGEHVALSTGTTEKITASRALNDLKPQTDGHGILELDGPTGGVVKSTVEDAMARNISNYASKITWGPLPNL